MRAAERLFAALTPLMIKPITEAPLDTATRKGLAACASSVLAEHVERDPGHVAHAEANLARAVQLACLHFPYDQQALSCVEAAYSLLEWIRRGKLRHFEELEQRPRHIKEALR